MSTVGELALWAAVLIAGWGAAAGAAVLSGAVRSNTAALAESTRRALWAAAILLALAVTGVAAALIAPDPSFAFAASSVTARMSGIYRLAALVSRLRGELLLTAFGAALFGVIAARSRRRNAPAGGATSFTSLETILCAVVLVLAALPIAAGANPYARGAPGAVAALFSPEWQLPFPPLARLAWLGAASISLVAAALSASSGRARPWWFGAWALGAIALVLSMRAALTAARWGQLDWALCAAWAVLGVWLHRRPARSRLASRLVLAGAIVALIAFAGFLMRAEHRIVLEAAESARLDDPFGSEWRFTSEGLSVYDELDRHAAVVLIAARHGAGTHRARVEWRQYIDDRGAPAGREVPVAGFLPGATVSAVVAFAELPESDSVTLFVRFVPLFMWWWLAAALIVAGAIAAIRREDAA